MLATGASFAADGDDGATWHAGPTPDVRAIAHVGDSLWVGTSAGLYLIDIRDPSRRVHVGAGQELASNSVRAVASQGDSVWVATDAGVTLFRDGRARVFSARESRANGALPLRRVQHVAFGRKGEVLLSTRRGGVGVLTARGGYAITTRDSLVGDDVFGVLERAGRPRLYACAAGLCAQVDDTTMVSFQAGAGLPRGEVRQVVGDERAAYVRIARRGVFHFDGMRAAPVDAPRGLSFVDASSIALGADHALWVAGADWACVRRGKKWRALPMPSNIAGNWRVIVADGAGAFIGSDRGVVLALDRGSDFRVTLGEGLPAPAVTSLRPDGRGSAWFVSGGRIVGAHSAGRRVVVENTPLDAEAVDFSPSGDLLVATRWTVSRRNGDGWVDMTPDVAETDAAFTSVFAGGDDDVWVGARSGALYRFDGAIWMRYARPQSAAAALCDARAFPAHDWAVVGAAPMSSVDGCWSRFAAWDSTGRVVDVAVSPSGDWFAATNERMFRYDAARDRWQPVSVTPASQRAWSAPRDITAITFDASGRLFIGTTDGLGCCADGKTRWWDVRDGIGGEYVADLATDATTLWIGYRDDGFAAVPLARLLAVFQQK